MLKQFIRHLSEKKLANTGDPIMLAVSGGVDSMVMLDLFIKAGFSVSVAHCNFQLRGKESEEDETFVKKTCEKFNVPFLTNRFATGNYAKENSISIQMAARELRYQWFVSLLNQNDFRLLATAHNLNDSIETVLFNWVNAASIHGFTGIPVKNEKTIRPLLFATRAQIEQYATENKITWREDSSNQTDDYKRNFIRHQITPRLKELNPSFETTFERGQRKLAGELSFFEKAFTEWKCKFISPSSDSTIIDKKAFEGIENGASILHKFLIAYGFGFDVCEEIINALHGQSGKKFITSNYLLVIDRDTLIITQHQNHWKEVSIENDHQKISLGIWDMEIQQVEKLEISQNPSVAMLDADLLKFPICWRKWKEGDSFYPLGMNHRKKLSDYLIDNKISISQKETLTVLESGGEIIWVVGYRIDNRFKLNDKTVKAFCFSVSPHFTQ